MTDCDEKSDVDGLTATWKKQVIEFEWRKTEGTKVYVLKLRNVKNPGHRIVDQPVYKNCWKCDIKDDIKYGQVYEMMVEFVWANNEIRRSSKWKKFLLGGDTVPVCPTAELNRENPHRSIILAWGDCEGNPEKYRIKSIPYAGKIKTYMRTDCRMIITQLKSDTVYTFEVQALFPDNKEGPTCETDKISTRAKPGSYLTTPSYSGIQGSTFNITSPISVHQSYTTKVTDPEFGKVRNVEMITRTCDKTGAEMALVKWEGPLFHGERDDYEIFEYEVVVKQGDIKYKHWNCHQSLCTTEFVINLGKSYVVSIKTKFQEIDTEKEYCADFKDEFYSRPNPPQIKVTECCNSVLVEWLCEGGAEEYRLEVYESNSLVFDWEGSKSSRNKEIDITKLNLGRYHKFLVTAFAKGWKSNSNSDTQIIGGDRVVQSARASLNKGRPFGSVDISWQSPEISPTKYRVRGADKDSEVLETKTTYCTVTGLRPGVKYRFEVIAVYDNYEGHPAKTDFVTTDPKPERISRVDCSLDDLRPDTCIRLNWKPSKSATMYKIRVLCPWTIKEHDVTEEKFVLHWLKPDTLYEIYVSAGNEEGFGEEYFVETRTEIDVPVDVRITWDAESQIIQATSSGGDSAEAIWKFYKYVGNVFVESEYSKLLPHQFKGNTEYYATVKFKQGEKESRTSRSNTLLTVPSEVRDVKTSRGTESPSTDIHIEWTPSEGLTYEVEFEADRNTEAIIRTNNSGKFDYRCLQEGNEYSVRIRAQNATGYGMWSQKEHVSLAPPRIRNLTAVKTSRSLTIHWHKPRTERLRSAISHFELKVTGQNSGTYVKETKDTSHEISPNIPGETYQFAAAAVDCNNVVGEYESGTVTIDGLLPPDFVSVMSYETNPMDIQICWAETPFADSYLVTCGEKRQETDQTFWTFVDARPKTEYTVQVFSKRENVLSDTCARERFVTGDLSPILYENIEIEKDIQQPWRFVTAKWRRPPGVSHFRVTGDGIKDSQEIICEQNYIRLENISSDRRMRVNIFPAIPGFVSDVCTSKVITFSEIPAIKRDSFKVELDEDCPWKYAKIRWELPTALECSRVTIKSMSKKDNMKTILERITQHTTLLFERPSDIRTYLVIIQSGYYPDAFSTEITSQFFQMGPDSPKVTKIDQVNNTRSKFMVYLDKEDRLIDKVIITASSENGTEKSYERDWPSNDKVMLKITDLPPGQTYSLHVESFFESHRRPQELIGTYELRPSVVQQLEAYCINRNTVVLKWLPHEDQTTKYRVTWESKYEPKDTGSKICDEPEAQLIGLRNGVKYEANVRAYVGECHGPEQVVTCTTGWSGDEIFKILVEETANKSENSSPLLPISFSVDGKGVVSLPDFVEQHQGKKILILGEPKSGKSTVCRQICKQIASWKTEQTLPILITSKEIFGKLDHWQILDRQWDWDLTEFEQKSFKTWAKSHGEKITYVFDDTEPGYGGTPNVTELLKLVSESTVYLVGSNFRDDFLGMTHYVKSSIHIDIDNADQVSQHLSHFGPQKAKAWNEIRQTFSDLCYSPKHFFAVIDFVKNENSEMKLSSPAWVYSKVYQALHLLSNKIADSEDDVYHLDIARDEIVAKIRRHSRLSDLVRFTFSVSNLNPPATPDEKFMLALQAVCFSPPLVLLSLLKNCDDENILLLCADCIHQNNRFEVFKLFPRKEWEDANSKLEGNIAALKNTDSSFTPKLGREFQDTFKSAAGIRKTT